jgi:hypothetical protein
MTATAAAIPVVTFGSSASLAEAFDLAPRHRVAGRIGDRAAWITTGSWWSCRPAASPLWQTVSPLTASETYVSFSS